MTRPLVIVLALLACALGCADKQKKKTETGRPAPQDLKGIGGERCDGGPKGRAVAEYDTSGDGKPDVRKVFLSLGEGVEARKVMICRETDLNEDERKDVVRVYDDEGRSVREESDRNLDGTMDMALVFQDGKVARKELDDNHDGRIDTKIFYDRERALFAERDLTGKSTSDNWKPNRWEYYEGGSMVRMGTDLNGDSRVDRWDRDATRKALAKDTDIVEDAAGSSE